MSSPSIAHFDKLRCPACRAELLPRPRALICSQCLLEHPIRDGIPDFLDAPTRGQRIASWMHLPEKIRNTAAAWAFEKPSLLGDLTLELWWWLFAQVYESPLGLRPALEEAMGGARSLEDITEWMLARVRSAQHLVLDAASGPGSLGRRLAGERGVFAVDISLPMLRKGAELTAAEHKRNIQFVRATVDSLPFLDATFDGALLGHALHWLPDAVAGLTEIARVLRPDAPLSGGTAKRGGTSRAVRSCERNGGHPFTVDELRQCLMDAGFVEVETELVGEVLLFAAKRSAPA